METAAKSRISIHVRAQTVSLMVIAAIALGACLYLLRPVLLPFVLALFFVCGLAPIFDSVQKRLKVSRGVAVAVTFVCGLGMVVLLWLVVWISIASLLEHSDVYQDRFKQLVLRFNQWIPDPPTSPVKEFTEHTSKTSEESTPLEIPFDPELSSGAEAALPAPLSSSTNEALSTEIDPADDEEALETEIAESRVVPPKENKTSDVGQEMAAFTSTYMRMAISQLSSSLMNFLGMATMVIIFMFFLLLGDTSKSVEKIATWREIEAKIRSYIVTKTVISVVTGVAFGFVLWLFDVPLAIVLGLLACLLNFIPNVGPLIACILPLPLILLHPELSWWAIVTVTVLAMAVQFISGNIVEPKVMGDSFELHPIAILLTLMLWGIIWGLPGMFLATPLTAALKILLEKFELTHPVAELLAGRWNATKAMSEDAV